MYGLLEKSLVQLVGANHELFMTGGGPAAIVDREVFNVIKQVLISIYQEDDEIQENHSLCPHVINTDISGLKTIVHPYWFDIDILNSITTGEYKLDQSYIACTNHSNLFNVSRFKAEFVEKYSGRIGVRPNPETAETDDDDENNGDEIVEERHEEIVEVENKGRIFIGKFTQSMSTIIRTEVLIGNLEGEENLLVTCGNYTSDFSVKIFMELKDKLKKNIVLVFGCNKSIFLATKNIENPSKILEHTLILFLDPTKNSDFIFSQVNESIKNMCFGKKISDLHLVSNRESENKMREINCDITLSESARTEAFEEIRKKSKISPYSNYDAIYKDTFTNIVWAVKDRCFVHFLFLCPIYTNLSNSDIMKVCIYEFGRRFNGKISIEELKEIDEKYWNSIASEDRKSYIEFAVKNSASILKEWVESRDRYIQKYKEAMSIAMESGKLIQKLSDQINIFDKSDFLEIEKKRVMENYEQTIKIQEVKAIKIEDNVINVYTHNLYCKDDRTGKYYDIGTFHITIGMMSKDYDSANTVRVMNTKFQIDAYQQGMQAPHIWPDGHICHGTLYAGMVEAYKRRDLFQLVYQLVLFLQDVNTDDVAGEKINKWPEVTKEEAEDRSFGKEVKKIVEKKDNASKKFDDMLADSLPIYI